ncbi:hypothetical protein FKP32DRAFT_1145972 [Trametes sanguinea]|nr:hypothetical protein FKP32DRAFT_1145972 [Trametes sanguinea]
MNVLGILGILGEARLAGCSRAQEEVVLPTHCSLSELPVLCQWSAYMRHNMVLTLDCPASQAAGLQKLSEFRRYSYDRSHKIWGGKRQMIGGRRRHLSMGVRAYASARARDASRLALLGFKRPNSQSPGRGLGTKSSSRRICNV